MIRQKEKTTPTSAYNHHLRVICNHLCLPFLQEYDIVRYGKIPLPDGKAYLRSRWSEAQADTNTRLQRFFDATDSSGAALFGEAVALYLDVARSAMLVVYIPFYEVEYILDCTIRAKRGTGENSAVLEASSIQNLVGIISFSNDRVYIYRKHKSLYLFGEETDD